MSPVVICQNCGHGVEGGRLECPHCHMGLSVDALRAANTGEHAIQVLIGPTRVVRRRRRRRRLRAAALAIVFGGLGAHRFFLGERWLGLAYLAFCWTLIPVLVGWLEGLNYLRMSDETFAELHAMPR